MRKYIALSRALKVMNAMLEIWREEQDLNNTIGIEDTYLIRNITETEEAIKRIKEIKKNNLIKSIRKEQTNADK